MVFGSIVCCRACARLRGAAPRARAGEEGSLNQPDRRAFLRAATAAAIAAALPGGMPRAGADEKFDLVIRGGEVIDPSQRLRARRDVGIRWGRVAAVEADISPERALQTIDAGGKLVLPGLIDMHAHVYPQASAIGLPADELVPYTATTTYVSAGDAGANNFSAFKHYVIAQARSRIFAFVHISSIGLAGFPVGEELNLDYLDVDAAARTVAENADVAIGVKVRMTKSFVGANGLEPLKRAIAAAERAGGGARVMCHIGDAPGDLTQLLDLLRSGDILTHTYSGAGNNIVQDGKVLPAALEAKKRGVLIDVGHGGGSFDYTVAEPAIAQGLIPDTIGSDIHAVSGNTPGMPYLPWVMSKFVNLGFSLEDVAAMATINPARAIGRVEKLGTLQIGAPADVSILELIEAPVSFVDTRKNSRQGARWLKPVQTVRAGRPFGRPYPQPFGYP
jgi:dihydroorotase